MTIRLACVALLLACPTQTWSQEPRSPRIERLRAELSANPRAGLDFWTEVQRSGTPLVESIPGDDQGVLVTFVWRGSGALRDVVVFASVLPENDPARQRLVHIPDTEVWYRTYRFSRDLAILYELSPDGPGRLQRDPLNPRFLDGSMGGSVVILPGARNREWSEKRPVTEGTVETIEIRSQRLNNDRTLTVYLPAGFQRGHDYDLLVVLDEEVYSNAVPLPRILSNLIGEGQLQPTVTVLVGNTDRAVELSCSPEFAGFLAEELLPWLERRYELGRKRERTTLAGSSLGGLAAAYTGWKRPDVFGNVISLSGSFRWRPRSEAEPEWLARQLAQSAPVPVRFYLGVGTHETGTPNEPGNPSLLTANRHLRNVLLAKGYAVTYREFPGAHEPLSWRAAIAEALVTMQRR